MKRIEPFKGTAEAHVVRHLRLPEKLFLAIVLGWAACGPVGCAHPHPLPLATVPAPHDAAGCVQACRGATAVELEPTHQYGDMCKCWAPNAFAYTFIYPDTAERLNYARERWDSGMRGVAACLKQGLPWGPDSTRDNIICVEPSGTERGRNYETPGVIPRRPDQSGRRT